MSDKKLNSVSSVTDAAYVYAETSNGETVKISKADLASVVAGIVRKTYQIPSKGMMNTGIKTKCMLISVNDSAAYTMGVHLIYSDGTFREITPNTTITYGTDVEGSMCVIAKGREIVLKNNTDSAKQVWLYAFIG